jgi:hypothetical protein
MAASTAFGLTWGEEADMADTLQTGQSQPQSAPVTEAETPPAGSGPPPSEAVLNLLNLLRRPPTETLGAAEATQALHLALQSMEASRPNGVSKGGAGPAAELTQLLRALDDFQSARESNEDATRRRQDNHRKRLASQRFVLLLVISFLSALLIAGGIFLASRSTPGIWHAAWLAGSASLILVLFLVTRELYPAGSGQQGH